MMDEEKKIKRMEYLEAIIEKYINTEPALSVKELAIVICQQVCDEKLLKFIKEYKKELTN